MTEQAANATHRSPAYTRNRHKLPSVTDFEDALVIEWKGLGFCESLASKYWYVPDYYLHGGSARIRDAVGEVAKILQRDLTLSAASADAVQISILTPGEIREHLLRLEATLDGDPHFRYGISLGPEAADYRGSTNFAGVSTQRVRPKRTAYLR